MYSRRSQSVWMPDKVMRSHIKSIQSSIFSRAASQFASRAQELQDFVFIFDIGGLQGQPKQAETV